LLYSCLMALTDSDAHVNRRPPLLGWPRLPIAVVASAIIGVLLSLPSLTPRIVVIARTLLVGMTALMAFGIVERWPTHLPGWVACWWPAFSYFA
jgi:hypothetical protein